MKITILKRLLCLSMLLNSIQTLRAKTHTDGFIPRNFECMLSVTHDNAHICYEANKDNGNLHLKIDYSGDTRIFDEELDEDVSLHCSVRSKTKIDEEELIESSNSMFISGIKDLSMKKSSLRPGFFYSKDGTSLDCYFKINSDINSIFKSDWSNLKISIRGTVRAEKNSIDVKNRDCSYFKDSNELYLYARNYLKNPRKITLLASSALPAYKQSDFYAFSLLRSGLTLRSSLNEIATLEDKHIIEDLVNNYNNKKDPLTQLVDVPKIITTRYAPKFIGIVSEGVDAAGVYRATVDSVFATLKHIEKSIIANPRQDKKTITLELINQYSYLSFMNGHEVIEANLRGYYEYFDLYPNSKIENVRFLIPKGRSRKAVFYESFCELIQDERLPAENKNVLYPKVNEKSFHAHTLIQNAAKTAEEMKFNFDIETDFGALLDHFYGSPSRKVSFNRRKFNYNDLISKETSAHVKEYIATTFNYNKRKLDQMNRAFTKAIDLNRTPQHANWQSMHPVDQILFYEYSRISKDIRTHEYFKNLYSVDDVIQKIPSWPMP